MNEAPFPGGKLQRKREKLGLSPDDVYRKLRVPPDCVRAFETADLDKLPVETYALGFLTTYCEFLGLDPEPYIEALREHWRAAAREARPTVRESLSGRPKWMRDALAWGAVCAILAIGWLAYSIVVQPAGEEGAKQVQAETEPAEPQDLEVPALPPLPR